MEFYCQLCDKHDIEENKMSLVDGLCFECAKVNMLCYSCRKPLETAKSLCRECLIRSPDLYGKCSLCQVRGRCPVDGGTCDICTTSDDKRERKQTPRFSDDKKLKEIEKKGKAPAAKKKAPPLKAVTKEKPTTTTPNTTTTTNTNTNKNKVNNIGKTTSNSSKKATGKAATTKLVTAKISDNSKAKTTVNNNKPKTKTKRTTTTTKNVPGESKKRKREVVVVEEEEEEDPLYNLSDERQHQIGTDIIEYKRLVAKKNREKIKNIQKVEITELFNKSTELVADRNLAYHLSLNFLHPYRYTEELWKEEIGTFPEGARVYEEDWKRSEYLAIEVYPELCMRLMEITDEICRREYPVYRERVKQQLLSSSPLAPIS